jgi:predicted DCC family thiol-disulfide oxidoreductase YuxK
MKVKRINHSGLTRDPPARSFAIAALQGALRFCLAPDCRVPALLVRMIAQPPPVPKSVTVWYDGNCPLCRREIAVMQRLDRLARIDFIDVTGEELVSCPLDRADLLARLHARESDRMLSGAAAFAAMWRAIPILRPLGLVARNRVMLALLEAGYRRFLRLRPRLQRFAMRFNRA